MLHILIRVVLGLFAINAYSTSLIECSITQKDAKSEKACFLKNSKGQFYISENCKSDKCLALKEQRVLLEFGSFITEFGKPGFKLCEELGGRPSLVDLLISGQSIQTDKCTFKDGSFVSTGYLIESYLKD